MGPGVAWWDVPLAVACALAGLVAVVQLATRRAPAADAAAHAAMGLGMAAMIVPAADVVPPPLWVAAFVVSGAWFFAAALRAGTVGGGAGRHLAGAVAMLFMLLVGHDHAAGDGAAGTAPHHALGHEAIAAGEGAVALLVTVVALVLAAWFAADVLRLTLRSGGDGRAGPPATVAPATVPPATVVSATVPPATVPSATVPEAAVPSAPAAVPSAALAAPSTPAAAPPALGRALSTPGTDMWAPAPTAAVPSAPAAV
ncbi:MAG: DUF5134 domain-containing protein, partial [Pseudonocardiales bacterium]|nr:DUF5134 domain-containing protein [Pseudonocardiales bacterium]